VEMPIGRRRAQGRLESGEFVNHLVSIPLSPLPPIGLAQTHLSICLPGEAFDRANYRPSRGLEPHLTRILILEDCARDCSRTLLMIDTHLGAILDSGACLPWRRVASIRAVHCQACSFRGLTLKRAVTTDSPALTRGSTRNDFLTNSWRALFKTMLHLGPKSW